MTGFLSFYKPMSNIFISSFDWETAFKDLEKDGQQDEYYMDPEEEEVWYCDICDKVFRSERHANIGNCDCNNEKSE